MRRVAIAALAVGAVAAIAVVFGPRVVRASQLARARERWSGCNIHDYVWTVRAGGFLIGPSPVEIEVVHDRVTSTNRSGSAAARTDLRTYPLTIPELFDRIGDSTGADSFDVAYDADCGFPRTFSADPSRNSVDDGFGFQVLDLRPSA